MTIISEELNYSSTEVDMGSYSISKIIQSSGGTDVRIPVTNSPDVSVFQIPASVVNLSKSYLSFVITYPVSDPLFNKVFCLGTPMIRTIQLVTRQGLFLCDLTYCSMYTNSVAPISHSNEEVSAKPVPYNGGVGEGISLNEGIFNNTANNIVPPLAYSTTARSSISSPYTGLKHIVSNDAANVAVSIRWIIPLSIFTDTILSLDKDQYFGGQSVFLNVIWEPSDRQMFTNNTGVNDITTLAGDAAVECLISELYFNVALETNIVAQEVARTPKSYSCPFVYSNRLSLTGAGLQSISVRYGRYNGSKLKKIIYSCYNGLTGKGVTSYDHSNVGAGKITSFYSTMNNHRLQQFNPVLASFEDYALMKPVIKGTPLEKSLAYKQSWVWVEDYTANNIRYNDSYLDDGFDLNEDVLYNMNIIAYPATALHHYIFGVTTRMITLGPDGMITLT